MDSGGAGGFIDQPRPASLRTLRALFIDTGAFLAKEIAADQNHRSAVEFWNRIHEDGPRIYSSEHVLDETATLLARRTSYSWSAEWGRDVLASGIHFLSAEDGDLAAAFALMKKFADQAVSFTDCVSFVLMKKQGLRDVFGFDRHFAAAGYRLWPRMH
jgi:uncharacterized protein